MNVNAMYILAVMLTIVSSSVGKMSHGDYFQKLSSSKLKESYHQFMKKSIDTCFVQSPCAISISKPDEPWRCKIQRKKGVTLNRQFYRLTVLGEKETIKFPLRHVPFLNQTQAAVALHTALDPVDSKWLSITGAIFRFRGFVRLQQKQNKLPRIKNFTRISGYKAAYHLHNKFIKMMGAPQYYLNPSMEKTFTDILTDDRWRSDDVFVQMRLAGMCPFFLRKVTVSGSVGIKWSLLKKQLNPEFNFDAAIRDALDLEYTLEEVVQKGMLYVLYHEGYNDMKTDRHTDKNESHTRKVISVTSPITLFVRTPLGELKVVSIQWDYKPESEVYTPKSEAASWMVAKSMANLVDFNICAFVWHLSHVHFTFTRYCAIFRRHFSELHPIYQIMQYHCQCSTPQVALSYQIAFAPNNPTLAIGTDGLLKLVQQGIDSYHYGLLAHDELLKKRGLDSDEIKYYPFRDDGKLLWDEFQRFAGSFVNIYYKADGDVQQDSELQSFANEASIDGEKAPYGGRAKIVGFPSSFNKKEEVTLFLTRFIWHIAYHAAVMYPLEPLATFLPLSPTKLYFDAKLRSPDNVAYMFPGYQIVEAVMSMGDILGNVRINRIMDHYDKINDETLSRLVEHHYHRLHQCVQKTLERRNALRKSKQQMGFQYFEPKWLTNSVHI